MCAVKTGAKRGQITSPPRARGARAIAAAAKRDPVECTAVRHPTPPLTVISVAASMKHAARKLLDTNIPGQANYLA
ncbi:hypothetical protein PGT21_014007 [Puccinia graminis f. sp. tritici]|uniref:Uncharacterized protein n=1 Tax=Puccinia graminis f. sp. tritici TaxID=56615 RepID=A0A5B0PVS2_PUCGR|nr:hypothetical protein PGTUg99_036883 [Puccinia graminis f. sp. tritici]KAA1104179.1 hypothetical protein PGT21_014007 [Puccinia graminis f. sp. tritici]